MNTVNVAGPHGSAVPRVTGDRNQSIEALRLIGAIGIVWFHLHLPGDKIAYSSLHVFVILAVFFGTSAPLEHHLRKLLLPWLLWSAIYGLAKLAEASIARRALDDVFAPWMLLTGPSIHLWFLPFLAMTLILAHKSGVAARDWPLWALAPVLLLALALSPLASRLGLHGPPLAQWLHVFPAAVMALWLIPRRDPRLPLALAVCLCATLWMLGFGGGTLQLALAATACLLAFQVRLPAHPAIGQLAALSFGVYLVHPLFISLLIRLGLIEGWLLLILTLLSSAAATLALKRVARFAV